MSHQCILENDHYNYVCVFVTSLKIIPMAEEEIVGGESSVIEVVRTDKTSITVLCTMEKAILEIIKAFDEF